MSPTSNSGGGDGTALNWRRHSGSSGGNQPAGSTGEGHGGQVACSGRAPQPRVKASFDDRCFDLPPGIVRVSGSAPPGCPAEGGLRPFQPDTRCPGTGLRPVLVPPLKDLNKRYPVLHSIASWVEFIFFCLPCESLRLQMRFQRDLGSSAKHASNFMVLFDNLYRYCCSFASGQAILSYSTRYQAPNSAKCVRYCLYGTVSVGVVICGLCGVACLDAQISA